MPKIVKFKSSIKPAQKPFLNEWVESVLDINPEGELFYVRSINLSPKGLLMHFDEFIVFLFKSSPLYADIKMFVEKAERGVSGRMCPSLLIELTDEYGGHDLGLDEENLAFYTRVSKKKYLLLQEGQETEDSTETSEEFNFSKKLDSFLSVEKKSGRKTSV